MSTFYLSDLRYSNGERREHNATRDYQGEHKMKSFKKKLVVRNLSAAVIWFSTIGAPTTFAKGKAAAEEPDNDSDADLETYQAPISKWRFGFALGDSPACFGSKREFGHYRCGRMTEVFMSPPNSDGILFKALFHNLKATRLVSEDQASGQRTYDIEKVDTATLQVAKNWTLDRFYYGLGAGIFSGAIERKTESEDKFGNLEADLNARYVSMSGYAFSAIAGRSLAKTKWGDINMELNQTWFVTSEADNPRDERRVWATMPTASAGWSYQFK